MLTSAPPSAWHSQAATYYYAIVFASNPAREAGPSRKALSITSAATPLIVVCSTGSAICPFGVAGVEAHQLVAQVALEEGAEELGECAVGAPDHQHFEIQGRDCPRHGPREAADRPRGAPDRAPKSIH